MEYTNRMSKATEKAYSIIRENILNGEYAPGAHLKEGELVEKCGVSRTPVRDALRKLAMDRYVVTRRNQGVFVNQWTVEDIQDIFELRSILESIVAERAARRITDDQIEVLRSIHGRIQSMLDKKSAPKIEVFLTENSQFHQILIDTAGSRTLADTLAQIVQPPLIAQTARQYTRKELQQSNDHHRDIVLALDARDGAWAASVMKTHIISAQRKFMNSYMANLDSEPAA